MAVPSLTAARLRELFSFDPDTGIFTRRLGRQGVRAGAVAGSVCPKTGRVRIGVDGRLYKAHRLAWLYVHGEWPTSEVDHKNGNPSDNRIDNLRDVGHGVNIQNQRRPQSNKKTGTKLGVSWRADCEKWYARIKVGGKEMPLGFFDTEDEAHAAYVKAKRTHHPGCMI